MPDVVRQEPEETPVPSHLATDSVRLIAFTGENVDPLSGAELDDSGNRAKSLTGHVAYHLGGPEALEQFREHDNRLTDPGAENFRRLIGDQPTLILVDELVLDIRSRNMNQVFRESPAWRKLIVPAEGRGMYRLNITLR